MQLQISNQAGISW